jgi:hypothetical protein
MLVQDLDVNWDGCADFDRWKKIGVERLVRNGNGMGIGREEYEFGLVGSSFGMV